MTTSLIKQETSASTKLQRDVLAKKRRRSRRKTEETNKCCDKKDENRIAWRVGRNVEHSWVSSSTPIMGWWLTSTSLMIRELKPISVSVLKTGNNMAKEREGGGERGKTWPLPPNPGGNYTLACQWKCWQPGADGFILVHTNGKGIVLYHTPS